MMRFSSLLILALAVFPAVFAWNGEAAHAAALERVTIVTGHGRQHFMVEKAVTVAQSERGLMFRRKLPPRGGMLFDFHTDQTISMWMKNTPLALDMIFIRADGVIAQVVADTVPESTTIITSAEPVRSVLEVRAGTAKALGIVPGNTVVNPMFPAH